MAVTISPSSIAPMIYGDSGVSVSLSGGTTSNYLWSSDTGTFSNRFSSSSVFSPKNNTATSIISGNTVDRVNTNPANVASLVSGRGYQKLGGSNGLWDSSINTTNFIQVGNASNNIGFIEFESNETTTEKAAGLLSSSSFKDPTTVHATNSFTVAWHLYSDGTAVPRNKGIALVAPVPYEAGSIFRVEVLGTTAIFKLKGMVIAKCALSNSTTLYGMASFKNSGATLDNMSFLRDTSTSVQNTGTTTVDVTGVLPVQPNYALDISEDNNSLSTEAEDGTMKFRILSSNKVALNLQYNARPYSEYALLNTFWRYHQKHMKFYYKTIITNEVYLVRFTSARFTFAGPDVYNISFSLKEV